MILFLGLAVIALAIWAVIRRVDVRLALLLAALALGVLAGTRDLLDAIDKNREAPWSEFVAGPMTILRTFLVTFADGKFVVPICSAMGFAHVLRHTQCDQHLVQLLVGPLRRVRPLLVPGTVVVGFLVNIPVISQTSTAVCVGSVLIPLLLAARVSPITAGSALLLGASVGGELLNPGAPEIGTIAEKSDYTAMEITTQMIFPLNMLQLCVAGGIFWALSLRHERRYRLEKTPTQTFEDAPSPAAFRVNYVKAMVPILPLILLFLAGPPLNVVEVPKAWLDPTDGAKFYSSRLVGTAMLVGVAAAVLTSPGTFWESTRVFFEGAGYAFTVIISLIVTATCFGEGVKMIGLAALLGQMIAKFPDLLVPLAGLLPMSFAFLSGSGMASTQSLFRFFAEPAQELNVVAEQVGAVVSLGSAAGRTMSPVAAVTLMCASLTGATPVDLVKRVAGPLLAGMTVVVIVAMVIAKC